VYGNVSEDDILLRQELQDLVERHPCQFKVPPAAREALMMG
jgi:NAD(P)H-flavin reductase